MQHTLKKHYIVLAMKKDGKTTSWLGLCEGSFDMRWLPDRVHLWGIESEYKMHPEVTKIPARTAFKRYAKKTTEQFNRYPWGNAEDRFLALKGRRGVVRKEFSDHKSKLFHPCGRSLAEYTYNWVKHYSKITGKHLREQGYEIKVFRAFSKSCPALIDMRERNLIERGKLAWDKFKWRNPVFSISEMEKA